MQLFVAVHLTADNHVTLLAEGSREDCTQHLQHVGPRWDFQQLHVMLKSEAAKLPGYHDPVRAE